MKDLTTSLFIVSLCFSLCLSCGDGNTANIEGQNPDILKAKTKKDRNPVDNLSKEEVIARMNKANNTVGVDAGIVDMVQKKKNQTKQKIGADQAEQSSRDIRRKYEEVKNSPPTPKQKKVADNICACLNKNPLFKTLKNAKTGKKITQLAGEGKDKEVKALQDCYNNNMVPAVNTLGEEAGIFAMKSRTYLNQKCLDGSDDFWINIGAHLNRKKKKAGIEIDMPKMEKSGLTQEAQ